MLAGEPPFRAETQVAVAMKHVQERMPDIQIARPDVSSSLAAVVDRATAKELRNRYASADELVHDLEAPTLRARSERWLALYPRTLVLYPLSEPVSDASAPVFTFRDFLSPPVPGGVGSLQLH